MPGRQASGAQQFVAHRDFCYLARAQRFITISQDLIRRS
jgi:hypothetical protein